jgi:hypothetical protein
VGCTSITSPLDRQPAYVAAARAGPGKDAGLTKRPRVHDLDSCYSRIFHDARGGTLLAALGCSARDHPESGA